MSNTCKTCEYFDTSEHYAPNQGFCTLEMPPWLLKEAKIDRYEIIQTVFIGDSCSFHKEAL